MFAARRGFGRVLLCQRRKTQFAVFGGLRSPTRKDQGCPTGRRSAAIYRRIHGRELRLVLLHGLANYEKRREGTSNKALTPKAEVCLRRRNLNQDTQRCR